MSILDSVFFRRILPIIIYSIGLIMNTICGIVLRLPEMKSPFNTLLIGLTFCDFVFGLFGLANLILEITRLFRGKVTYILMFFTMAGQSGSIYFTIAISLERFAAICWPLRARAMLTNAKAKRLAIWVLVLSVLLNIPEIFPAFSYLAQFDLTWKINTHYLSWFRPLFKFLIPFLVLIYLNVRIYLAVRKARQQRANMTSQQGEDASITKTLFLIVIIFGICYLPILVFGIIAIVVHRSDDYMSIMDLAYDIITITQITLSINASLNLIIYITTGKKFKAAFLKTFCSKHEGQRNDSFRTVSYSRPRDNDITNVPLPAEVENIV